jgi:hypothetical protein
MKDERITLETAKLAKVKNFNIRINGSYVEYLVDKTDPEYPEGGGAFSMKKGEVEFDSDPFINNGDSDYSNELYEIYAAPTQSLLVRWLREVHNIQVYCYSSTKNGEGIYRDYVVHVNEISINDARDEEFQTYEEAMEAGLKIVLRDYIK